MSVKLLKSPFENEFRAVVKHVQREIVFSSPYINEAGVSILLDSVGDTVSKRISILTNLSTRNIVDNVTQPSAILKMYDAFGETTVSSLSKLHAKVYIVDETVAVITSANLTYGGLKSNFEYGILIDDKPTIRTVKQDVLDYAALGNVFDQFFFLTKIYEESRKIEREERKGRQPKEADLRRLLEQQQKIETLLVSRYDDKESRHSIFTKTIRFVLQKHGALTTEEMQPLIQNIHPEMCDDTIKHIADNGRDYGIRWKHDLRNAQISLKKAGIIKSEGQPRHHIWSLTTK